MYRVFIDGQEGTTGLRIQERLRGLKDLTLLTLPGERRKDAGARAELLHEADIAFLCLPDDAAREAVALSEGSDVRIIDASTAHRTLEGWQYGFPELSAQHAESIRAGSRIAVPGCHASGFIALVHPLVAAGALPPDAQLSCLSLTGYSGGGKSMIAEYQDGSRSHACDAPRIYATAQAHKHLPEMCRHAGLEQPPVFNPIVADYYAGMLVSIPLHGAQFTQRLTPQQVSDIYAAHYAGCALVHALPFAQENQFLNANALAGRDSMEIFVAGSTERVTLYARFDNLGKGASGAAIQCMNLMLGLPETAGLVL